MQSPPEIDGSRQRSTIIALGVQAKTIQHEYEAFVKDLDPEAYTKSVMCIYFTDKHQQGLIDVFTDALDDIYEFRR